MSKNENGWLGLKEIKEWLFSIWVPAVFMYVVVMLILELAKFACYFKLLSKVYGSRAGATEMLMISVQKWQFLAISENWTNIYVCCSCKLIIKLNNKCFVYIHSLDFSLIIYVRKIGLYHIS